MKRIVTAFILFGLISSSVLAEGFAKSVKTGNEAYYNQDYKTALEHYHIAETALPESPELDYNMAGVLFNQGKYEEAIAKFERSLNSTDIDLAAKAQYNLGNTHYRAGDFQKAITSYQEALEINPNDVDAKYNLELARKMLKEQMKPENQDQEKQDQQDKQQQQKQDEEKKEDEQSEQEQQKEDQQNNQDQQDQQQQPQDQESDPQKMSKEDAERILNALKDDEQDIQKKIKRHKAKGNYGGKDW